VQGADRFEERAAGGHDPFGLVVDRKPPKRVDRQANELADVGRCRRWHERLEPVLGPPPLEHEVPGYPEQERPLGSTSRIEAGRLHGILMRVEDGLEFSVGHVAYGLLPEARQKDTGGHWQCAVVNSSRQQQRDRVVARTNHECKPPPDRDASASTSTEETKETARPDRRKTIRRAGARSQSAADVFTIPLDDQGEEAAPGGGLAGRGR
jgi:hypothetical protein